MDDLLQKLERAHAQDPGDLEVARTLKAMLARSGKVEEVRQRFKLGFVCDVRWDAMARTGDPRVRQCATCQRDVHTAQDYAEFDQHAALGRCVSVEPKRLPLVLDGMIGDPKLGLRRGAKDPCLVEGEAQAPFYERPLAGKPARYEPEPPPPPPPPPPSKGLLKRFLGLFGG